MALEAQHMSGEAGPRGGAARAAPERRCIVTRESEPRDGMIRFVVGPDRTLVPDLAESLGGRGLWLTARRDIVDTACARKLFAKAARGAVDVPEDLADQLERLLVRRVAEFLGLARRAGQLATGFDSVRKWLADGRAGLIVAASDASDDGVRKLRSLDRGLPRITVLDRFELGQACGREEVVHGAVAPGRLADALVREAHRLSGFRGARAPQGDGDDGRI